MIGGFLGAGKTTAILKLAQHLTAQGLKVGLITNDQSVGLVDTAMLSRAWVRCAGNNRRVLLLPSSIRSVDAANQLSKQTRPDVFIAEPVGSCTDLKASVSYPFAEFMAKIFPSRRSVS